MNIIYRMIRKVGGLAIRLLRLGYCALLRLKLKNKAPSIISCNCIGGRIYHNLGLQFRSPTINLYFSKEDFIVFVRYLKEYLCVDPVEIVDPSVTYPVGLLEYNGIKVRINFMHYKTFAEARDKWIERRERVNLENIYFIQIIQEPTKNDIAAFDSLPYRNKLLIAGCNPAGSKNVYIHPVLRKEGYRPGEILKYKSKFSIRRYMDAIDYVSFLNRPN